MIFRFVGHAELVSVYKTALDWDRYDFLQTARAKHARNTRTLLVYCSRRVSDVGVFIDRIR